MEQPFVRPPIGFVERKLRRRATDIWNAETRWSSQRPRLGKTTLLAPANQGR
jgi:hypothetical protein